MPRRRGASSRADDLFGPDAANEASVIEFATQERPAVK